MGIINIGNLIHCPWIKVIPTRYYVAASICVCVYVSFVVCGLVNVLGIMNALVEGGGGGEAGNLRDKTKEDKFVS